MPNRVSEKDLWKGLLAGLIAGVAATAAKSVAERIFPPRTHGEPEPPEVLAETLAGHSLEEGARAAAGESLHWGFGAAAGALYGVLAEIYPQITAKKGASFGLALMSLTHGGALPAFGLAPAPEEQTTREHTSEMASHVVYGFVAEETRQVIRKMLD